MYDTGLDMSKQHGHHLITLEVDSLDTKNKLKIATNNRVSLNRKNKKLQRIDVNLLFLIE